MLAHETSPLLREPVRGTNAVAAKSCTPEHQATNSHALHRSIRSSSEPEVTLFSKNETCGESISKAASCDEQPVLELSPKKLPASRSLRATLYSEYRQARSSHDLYPSVVLHQFRAKSARFVYSRFSLRSKPPCRHIAFHRREVQALHGCRSMLRTEPWILQWLRKRASRGTRLSDCRESLELLALERT